MGISPARSSSGAAPRGAETLLIRLGSPQPVALTSRDCRLCSWKGLGDACPHLGRFRALYRHVLAPESQAEECATSGSYSCLDSVSCGMDAGARVLLRALAAALVEQRCCWCWLSWAGALGISVIPHPWLGAAVSPQLRPWHRRAVPAGAGTPALLRAHARPGGCELPKGF